MTILHGGHVETMEGGEGPARRRPTALAHARGRVVAVGSDDEVRRAAPGRGVDLVDLQGAIVLPGFIDAGAHLLMTGLEASWPDLSAVSELPAALALLSERAALLRRDEWLQARYDEAAWTERRPPTRDELDHFVPDRPVVLAHATGTRAVASSLALTLAGITPGSRDWPGIAELERDEHGRPTGVIVGPDPLTPFAAALPPLTAEGARDAIVGEGTRLAASGVTCVVEGDLGAVAAPVDELAAYVGAALDDALPQRLGVLVGLARLARPDEEPPTPYDIAALIDPEAADRVRVVGGRLTARATDRLSGELAARLRQAESAGWQVETTAADSEAIGLVLDEYGPANPRRHRVQLADGPDERFATRIAHATVPLVLSVGARSTAIAHRILSSAGMPVAFASGSAAAGMTPVGHAVALSAGGEMGAAAALRCWTAGAADARGYLDAGRLSPGLRADLVILSADPAALEAGTSPRAQVVATVVAGRPVFDSLGLPEPRVDR